MVNTTKYVTHLNSYIIKQNMYYYINILLTFRYVKLEVNRKPSNVET